MTKKEKMELLLAKVAEEQKDEWREVVKKYGIRLSEEEKEAFNAQSNEVSDEDLDAASGGCCVSCSCTDS